MICIPEAALRFGFKTDRASTHSSRTMMLADLRILFAACPANSSAEEYRRAILDDNVLGKETASTRLELYERLHALYGLDRALLLYRALRDLWNVDVEAQPLLALLCAVARDALLRATIDIILNAHPGESVASLAFADSVRAAYPGRFNEAILKKIAGNVASTWTQSGHLSGRTNKTRGLAVCRPVEAAYALLLGYLCDARGEALFQTVWARLLDTSSSVLHDQAFAASQQGWLEYRRTGDVTDVQFSHFLRAGQ